MAVFGKIFRISNIIGQYRNNLFNRNTVSIYQQNAGLKQSVEEKLGLPPKPKKPLTPYFRFMAQIRPNIVQKNPEANSIDVVKMIAKAWEKADTSVREKLEIEYKQDMQKYVEEQVKYEHILTDEQRDEIKKAKLEIAASKGRKKLKKKMKEMGKPKRPMSPFLMFLEEKKDRGSYTFREWQKIMSKEWEKLPQEKKDEYLAQYRKSLEGYRRELQTWEEKMIRLGHIDVVRNQALIQPKEGRGTKVSRRSKVSEE